MASIITNSSAMTALQSLNSTNKNLETTQGRISTGLRVNDAADNAAYWSIATTMRSDNKALSTVQDALGLGASKVDTAYTGMNKAIETVNDIKAKLVASIGSTDSDKAKYQTEIKALQDQLKAYADAATFSGSNMLSVTSTKAADGTTAAATGTGVQQDVKVVSAFNRTSTGTASISTIDIKVEEVKLYDGGTTANLKSDGILDRTTSIYASSAGQAAYTTAYNNAKAAASANTDADAQTAGATAGAAAVAAATAGTPDAVATTVTYSVSNLDITGANVTDAVITSMVKRVDDVIGQMTTAATKLGAAKSRIDLQKTFTASLMDSIDRGVGQLVDADMNKESTRLQALQVQQQLGIQALSIANGNSQSILSLFR